MSVEAKLKRPARARRTSGDRLREALMTLAKHRAQVITHSEKAWASITFAGTRHSLTLVFAGADAVEAGEHFVAELPTTIRNPAAGGRRDHCRSNTASRPTLNGAAMRVAVAGNAEPLPG